MGGEGGCAVADAADDGLSEIGGKEKSRSRSVGWWERGEGGGGARWLFK